MISTVAGTGNAGYSGDGGQATSALLNFPAAVAVDSSNNLYIADTENAVIRTVNANHAINTIIGDHGYGFGGDGGPALQATLTNPFGLAVDAAGDVWVADYWNNRIRMYAVANGNFNTVVGNGSVYDGLAATSASLYFPRGPALDSKGNLYITDEGNNRIREVDATTGIISTVAGTNVPCPQSTQACGDGGPATSAGFYNPHSVNLDPTDTYMNIADTGNNKLRQVNTGTGIVSTIAGTGVAGFTGDGGPASAAEINSPRAPSYDSLGNLYFVDTSNHRIRKIDKTTGIITTVVGSGGFAAHNQGCGNGGYSGDGGPATSAMLQCPLGMAIDANDNIYIADYLNSAIRKVDAKTQIITTVVGNGTPGYTGDNGPASAATLSYPDRVSVNGAGNLFISDTGNNVVRRVDAGTQIITTFVGSGAFGFSGDGGPALSAALAQPTGVVVTNSGDLYLGDLLEQSNSQGHVEFGRDVFIEHGGLRESGDQFDEQSANVDGDEFRGRAAGDFERDGDFRERCFCAGHEYVRGDRGGGGAVRDWDYFFADVFRRADRNVHAHGQRAGCEQHANGRADRDGRGIVDRYAGGRGHRVGLERSGRHHLRCHLHGGFHFGHFGGAHGHNDKWFDVYGVEWCLHESHRHVHGGDEPEPDRDGHF